MPNSKIDTYGHFENGIINAMKSIKPNIERIRKRSKKDNQRLSITKAIEYVDTFSIEIEWKTNDW